MPFGVSITCNVSPFETRSFARISLGKTTPVEFPTVVSFSAFIITVIITWTVCGRAGREGCRSPDVAQAFLRAVSPFLATSPRHGTLSTASKRNEVMAGLVSYERGA